MHTMARVSRRSSVTAVHAYEDCSLLQFEAARRRGQACIYDMPIGYYPAWEVTQAELARRFADWLPAGGLASSRYARPEQKRREMELADLVLVPGSFVESTIREFLPEKMIARTPYGVDSEFWRAPDRVSRNGPLRFVYAGQISLRKGIPVLLQAWEKAALRDAELELVGSWHLADARRALPPRVTLRRPLPPAGLRGRYAASDVFVFPSYFEGFGLVLLEALSCGLPVVASNATAGPDVITKDCGQLVVTGDTESLIHALRWFAEHRDAVAEMSRAARLRAETWSWSRYRICVADAVAPFA
jgi:glycosyltransferase involved in cell wall biosynthesis